MKLESIIANDCQRQSTCASEKQQNTSRTKEKNWKKADYNIKQKTTQTGKPEHDVSRCGIDAKKTMIMR